MLSNSLNANQIKNSAGTGVNFSHLDMCGRKRIFAKDGESPSLWHRLSINHAEIGAGKNRVRRSNVRVDYQVLSEVDLVTPVFVSVYTVAVLPVGHLTALTAPTLALANLNSFMSSLGANTTILYDGTGSGTQVLLTGGM